MSDTATPADAMLTTPQLAARLNFQPKTLFRWRKLGRGPAWIRVEGRIRYRASDVEAWVADRYHTDQKVAA